MTNLLEETIESLEERGKTFNDVLWCGSSNFGYLTVEDFKIIAAKINYDSGYGGAEIPGDLVVVGKDWWLERGEYDGSEWWEFKVAPVKPERQLDQTTKLKVVDYEYTLKELNKGRE